MTPHIPTGKLVVSAYDVICPVCGEHVANDDDGSMIWLAFTMYAPTVECIACGTTLRVPKRLRREGGES